MTSTETHPSANGDLVNRVQQLRLDDQLGTAKRAGGGSWLPWTLCVLMAVSWAGVGVQWYKASGTRTDPAASPDAGPGQPSVSGPAASRPAEGPTAAAGEILLQLKGNLIPSLQIAVSPRDVVGEITGITFWEGKLVKKGDVLATLLDLQYSNRHKSDEAAALSAEAQVAKAKAGEAGARVRVAKAEAARAAAQARVTKTAAVQERAGKDFEQAKAQRVGNAISAQEFQKFEADKAVADADKVAADAELVAALREVDATKADVSTAEATLRAAESEAVAARARLAEAKRLLDNCTVIAPISGTVLTKKADQGSLVSPVAFNVAATLCEIADLSKLEVEMDVPERQITKLRPMLDCEVAADANPGRVYHGYIDRVMPIADDSKNVIKVRVRVYLKKGEIPGSFLKPKMSVVVTAFNRDFVEQPTDQAWQQ